MSFTDVSLTGEQGCRSCGHPKWMECPCGCCVADEEAQFAELLDSLAAGALKDGDIELSGYLMDASDWHQEPPPARVTARLHLLSAAVGRNEDDR